jgi:uncharacterized protein YgbK (DUF1537 family)
MTDPDLVRWLGRQTPRPVGLVPLEVVRRGPGAVGARVAELAAVHAVADAVDDDDLRTLGEAAADLPLVTGGSGLALGLPDAYRRRGLASERSEPVGVDGAGPAAVIAGSCSAATREQVARMAARHASLKVEVGADPAALAAEAAARLGDGPVLLYSTAPPDEVARVQERVGAAQASAELEGALGDVARRLVDAGVRRLVVAGGETSGAVLQALGIRALAVGREIAPGVPWMTSLGEPRLALALKSGNFGGPDFFLEALGEAA